MEMTSLIGIGAIGAAIVGFWNQIKNILWRIVGIFIQQVEIEECHTNDILIDHLVKNFKRSPFYDQVFSSSWSHLNNGQYILFVYEKFGKYGIMFWNGRFPFFYGKTIKSDITSEKDKTQVITITYIRGTLNIDKLFTEAQDAWNEKTSCFRLETAQNNKRYFVKYLPENKRSETLEKTDSSIPWYHRGSIRLISHKPNQLGKINMTGKSCLEQLIFPPKITKLINEVKIWYGSREWYQKKGIPWKRGWLIYGPPGTGKTALARAFAEDLDLPIYVYNLAEMGNYEFSHFWRQMQTHTPCIALIEDIDNVFHGRDNVACHQQQSAMMMRRYEEKKKGAQSSEDENIYSLLHSSLTFDTLLNCLDGVERADGVFTIITTNDIAKIDDALGVPRKLENGTTEVISTRPGRIDKAIELSYLEREGKILMINRILEEFPQECQEMLDYVEKNPNAKETPAQFQERCSQIALESYWKQTHPNKEIEKEISQDDNFFLVKYPNGTIKFLANPNVTDLSDDLFNEEESPLTVSSTKAQRWLAGERIIINGPPNVPSIPSEEF